jgi:lipoxygenase
MMQSRARYTYNLTIFSGITSCCLPDDEFGRQAVAGISPLSIERLTIFPPVSKLDASIYGPQESALKEEHIIGHLNGMSLQQVDNLKQMIVLMHYNKYMIVGAFLPFAGIGEKQAVHTRLS